MPDPSDSLAGIDAEAMPELTLSYYDGLKVALANLEILTLLVRCDDLNFSAEAIDANVWPTFLPEFLIATPLLQHLSLTFTHWSCDPDEHFASQATNVFGACASVVHLPHLSALELGNVAVRADDLIRFMRRHAKSLTKLTLNSVLLIGFDWSHVFASLVQPGALWTANVAWLSERKSTRPGDRMMLLFKDEGFRNCNVCEVDREFTQPSCQHIGTTFGPTSTEVLKYARRIPETDDGFLDPDFRDESSVEET